MAEIATKPKPVAKIPQSHKRGMPAARVAVVVDKTAELSSEVLQSLEASERTAIQAVGQFVITIEETLPQEVAATSDVAKMITESCLEMADRLVHAGNDLMRNVLDSAAKPLRTRDGVMPKAA